MKSESLSAPSSHVVDILGSTRGRDQAVMMVDQAFKLIECITKDSFSDKNIVFLDPFCKAGETLIATAAQCALTTSDGRPLPEGPVRVEDIMQNKRIFGLALDDRHFLLSRRTFYGNEKSHNVGDSSVIQNGAYLTKTHGRLQPEKFKKEFRTMVERIKNGRDATKIVCIGNPPYHESDGGPGGSARPIYNFFVEHLLSAEDVIEFSLVIPARWFASGKGLSAFREKIQACRSVKTLHYFERPEDIFPTVNLQGGLCFLHVDKRYKGDTQYICGSSKTMVDLSQFDIIPDDPMAAPIIRKVTNGAEGKYVFEKAWNSKPFGLRTNHFKKNAASVKKNDHTIICVSKGHKRHLFDRRLVVAGADCIDMWKVAVPGAYGLQGRCTLRPDKIFILKPGEICTESYNIVGVFASHVAADNFVKYLQTFFCRYMLGLRKTTQHISRSCWRWVPYLTYNRQWSDKELFEKFNISSEEQAHILKKVETWS